MKIEELNLSVRTRNCLRRGKIDTVEQLMATSDDELMNIRSFGLGCLKEVHQILGRTKQPVEENKTCGGQCRCRKKSAEIQAVFRLGQKDMQESFILLLQDNPHATHEGRLTATELAEIYRFVLRVIGEECSDYEEDENEE